jgi:hypothetical protein
VIFVFPVAMLNSIRSLLSIVVAFIFEVEQMDVCLCVCAIIYFMFLLKIYL